MMGNDTTKMHVSVGRIRLKPRARRPLFLWHAALAYLQARFALESVYVAVQRTGPDTFWSMSVWKSMHAMLSYRNSGNHRRAMKVSSALADRIDFAHWESASIPAWQDAMREFERQVKSKQAPSPDAHERRSA